MSRKKILMVATSADKMANGEATGLWLEELTAPYYAFADVGADVTIASIKGGSIPIDQRSLAPKGENDASVDRYLDDVVAQNLVENSAPLSRILQAENEFDALFLPGGHGTMFDYPNSDELAQLVEAFDRANKVVAAVCHGPVGLTAAKKADGTPLVAGRTIAAFTDSEEHAVGLQDAVPFLLETRLRELGANVSIAPDFQAHAVRDGRLITGQNPVSAKQTATLILDALSRQIAS